ncbi:MAG TPA: malectin [Pirellulales bacterium]|nr:malectin [Pirellulales bacterium]
MSYKTIFVRCLHCLMLAAIVSYVCSSQPSAAQSDGKTSDAKSSAESPIIRFRAGSTTPYKDSQGHTWLPDVTTKEGGFEEGDTIDRPDEMEIKNTKDPALYRSEHYSMKSFWYKVPNGKYVIKLHFAETFDGIGGPGDRVFSFKVQDKEFKDFDVWKKAGGPQRAYIESVPVEITDGKLKITFTPNVENPEINGIEIIPADKAALMDKDATKASADEKPTTGK